jgi:hypothetical protein
LGRGRVPGGSRTHGTACRRAAFRKASVLGSGLRREQFGHAGSGLWSAKNRWNLLPCSAEPVGRFCSAQKFERSSGPKAQPFIQRRAKPWYIGRTACYILLCLAVFGPTGQVRLNSPTVCVGLKMNSWPVGPDVAGNKKGLWESAGINRYGAADERAVQERSSEPS